MQVFIQGFDLTVYINMGEQHSICVVQTGFLLLIWIQLVEHRFVGVAILKKGLY
jgi:hypothetical protein